MSVLLPVVLQGTVIHGKHLARHLGMPTANIIPEYDCGVLAMGVYFSETTIDGIIYPSISNLGKTPTIPGYTDTSCETYIYNFSEDIYEKSIQVRLLKFHRAEVKFDSVEELTKSMQVDLNYGKIFHGIK